MLNNGNPRNSRFSIGAAMDHARLLQQLHAVWRGYAKWLRHTAWSAPSDAKESIQPVNPLRKFFEERNEGRGLWKWIHYFDVYERHFNRFRGQEVHIVEIGIYSGGSLEMWKEYFGPRSRIYGVDIEPACKAYENDSVKVFIGDQADRNFWKHFKREVPVVDIVIDDGGHRPEQQIATLEELLPHLRPGGIFFCEDVHGTFNKFAAYVYGLAHNLNASEAIELHPDDHARRIVCRTTPMQSAIRGVYLYPYVTVIERNDVPIPELIAPKHGTQWAPFLK